MAEVGEDFGRGWCVEDDADAEFVGGAFASEGDIGCFRHGCGDDGARVFWRLGSSMRAWAFGSLGVV